jgi:hypothetical protein
MISPGNVFRHSSFGLILLWFAAFAVSTIAMATLVSTFFSTVRARLKLNAALTAALACCLLASSDSALCLHPVLHIGSVSLLHCRFSPCFLAACPQSKNAASLSNFCFFICFLPVRHPALVLLSRKCCRRAREQLRKTRKPPRPGSLFSSVQFLAINSSSISGSVKTWSSLLAPTGVHSSCGAVRVLLGLPEFWSDVLCFYL